MSDHVKLPYTPLQIQVSDKMKFLVTLEDVYNYCLAHSTFFDDLLAAVSPMSGAPADLLKMNFLHELKKLRPAAPEPRPSPILKTPHLQGYTTGKKNLALKLDGINYVLPKKCFESLLMMLHSSDKVNFIKDCIEDNVSWKDAKSMSWTMKSTRSSEGGCHWDDCPDTNESVS